MGVEACLCLLQDLKNNFIGGSWRESDSLPQTQKARNTEEYYQNIDFVHGGGEMLPSAGLDVCSCPAVDSGSHVTLCSSNNNFRLFGYNVNKTHIVGCAEREAGRGSGAGQHIDKRLRERLDNDLCHIEGDSWRL